MSESVPGHGMSRPVELNSLCWAYRGPLRPASCSLGMPRLIQVLSQGHNSRAGHGHLAGPNIHAPQDLGQKKENMLAETWRLAGGPSLTSQELHFLVAGKVVRGPETRKGAGLNEPVPERPFQSWPGDNKMSGATDLSRMASTESRSCFVKCPRIWKPRKTTWSWPQTASGADFETLGRCSCSCTGLPRDWS